MKWHAEGHDSADSTTGAETGELSQAADAVSAPAAAKPRRWLAIVIALLLVGAGVFFFAFFHLPSHMILDAGPGATPVGPVASTTMYVQPLSLASRMRVSAVEVDLATWGKPTNTTRDRLALYGADGNVITSVSLPPGSVADNVYHRVVLEPAISAAAGTSLYLALSSSDGTTARSITAWSTNDPSQSPYYVLTPGHGATGSPIASLPQARSHAGAICVRRYGLGPRALAAERVIAVAGLLLCLVAAALVLFWRPIAASGPGRWLRRAVQPVVGSGGAWDRITVAHAYLVFALLWGTVMVFLVPPFQVPDENAHYFRSWSVAEFQVLARRDKVVTVPENVAKLPDRIGSAVADWSTNHYSPRSAQALLWEPLSSRLSETSTGVASAGTYGPIGYLPQAFGIEFARLIGRSPLLGFYLARLFNLVASVLIVFFALRLIPFGRPLVALVALLPMTVAEMASVSPDGLALSGALLIIALVLNLSRRRDLSMKNMLVLGVAAALLLNAKPGYAVLSLLVFMLAPRQLGGARRWLVGVLAVLAAVFGLAAVLQAVAPPISFAALAAAGVVGVDPATQLHLVLSNPIAFLQVLAATFAASWTSLLGQTYGVLGWLTVAMPTVGLLTAALAGLLFLERDEVVPTTPWQRLVLGGTATVLVGELSVMLYLSWTAVGAPTIDGLQGRYFIPVVLLGLLTVYGIRMTRRRTVVAVLLASALVFAVTSLWALARFFY